MNFGLEISEAPKTASDARQSKYKRAERISNFLSTATTPTTLPKKVSNTIQVKRKNVERPWSPDKNEAMSFSLV